MKFDIKTERDTFMEIFVMHVIAHTDGLFDHTMQHKSDEGIDVKLLIDGKEADARTFINHVESQLEHLVLKKAEELVKDRIFEMTEKLRALTAAAETAALKAFPDIDFKKEY